MQYHDLFLGSNRVDDFEGLVLRYNPSGGVDWSQDYGQEIVGGLINGWN
jgi:hypothetical protein